MTESQKKLIAHIKEHMNTKECLLHNLEQEAMGCNMLYRPIYESLIGHVSEDLTFAQSILRSYLAELGITEDEIQSLIF